MSSPGLETEYVGRRGRLFGLALVTTFLTVLTLGIYRFWMKTRLRRFYWSAIRPDGHPLEYVGQPLEKLLGFLVAVVFLAFYLGVVNLILMFVSFSLFNTNFAAYAVSFVGVLPIIFYAQFRARRYILARTRWRGIRFGMEAGAVGYAWRAALHWTITILTLGLLWPRMTFLLEKYRTDRTYFGTERFEQTGNWRMLYPVFWFVILGAVVLASGAAMLYQGDNIGLAFAIVGVLIFVYGIVYYSVNSFRILTNAKTLGSVRFDARPRPWRVFMIYGLGNLLVWTGVMAVAMACGLVMFGVVLAVGPDAETLTAFERIDAGDLAFGSFGFLPIALILAMYFLVFVSFGVLRHVFVLLPLARHYAETLEIQNPTGLATVQQRERDDLEQAEGFADALDVGAAI